MAREPSYDQFSEFYSTNVSDLNFDLSTNATNANGTNNVKFVELDEADFYPDLTQIPAVCIAFIVIYLINMVMALFGNVAVCWTVLSNRKMQTVVNYYIVNLAVCDFMVGAFVLPMKLLELTAPAHWNVLNDGLCTSTLYSQTVCVFASILTLVATCVERYFAIVHPLESRIQQSKSRTIKILLVVWTLSLVGAGPFLFTVEANENTLTSHYGSITRLSCFAKFSDDFRRGYFTFLFVFFYAIPLTSIAWTCLRITQCLLKSTALCRESSLRRQEANRRKVAKMVLIVVAAFAISWTPYFVVSIITQYQEENYLKNHNYFFTMLCINLFAFINSSINPFIYASMSTRFRNGFTHLFRYVLCASRVIEEEGQLIHESRGHGNPFATFQKYHQQIILFACGEPTQISTDSLPTESQHTVAALAVRPRSGRHLNFNNHLHIGAERHKFLEDKDHAMVLLKSRTAHLHLNPISGSATATITEPRSQSLAAFNLFGGELNSSQLLLPRRSDSEPDRLPDANRLNRRSRSLSRARSETLLNPSHANRPPACELVHLNRLRRYADCDSRNGGSESLTEEQGSCQISNGQVIVHSELPQCGTSTATAMSREKAPLNGPHKKHPIKTPRVTMSHELEHIAYIDSEV